MNCIIHKRKIFIQVFLIVVVSLFIYGNTLRNSFIYDDQRIIEECEFIQSWKNLPDLFNVRYFDSSGEMTYRPTVSFTYLVDYTFWKLNSVGYHLTNVIIHSINGILLFFLMLNIFKKHSISLICSLLFVTHPVATEAINAVCFREDLLALSFSILSFIFYLKGRESSGSYPRYYLGSCCFFLLAVFSKENAFSLFPILCAYDIFLAKTKDRADRERLMFYFIFAAAVVFYLAIRFYFLKNPDEPPFAIEPFFYRLLSMSRMIVLYIKLFLFPLRLSAEYVYTFSTSLLDIRALLSIMVVVAILFISKVLYRYNNRISFGIWWIFLSLVPVLNIIPLFNPVAERYAYFALPGYCMMLVLVMEMVYSRVRGSMRFIAISFLGLLLIFYSVRTVIRNSDWRTPIMLYERTLKQCPNSARFLNNLGLEYGDSGKHKKAIELFKKAMQNDPDYAYAYYNIGRVYDAMKNYNKSIESYTKAIDIDPEYKKAHYNLGIVYGKAGKPEKAIALYKKAIELDPQYTNALYNLGNTYYSVGNTKGAIVSYEKAIALDPYYTFAYNNLGVVCSDIKKYQESIELLKKALELNPDYADAHNNLAVTYFHSGQYDLAEKHCRKAVSLGYKIHPGFLEALESKCGK